MHWWFEFFKRNTKKTAILGVLTVFFVCGFLLIFHSWDGKVYVHLGEGKFRKLAEAGEKNVASSVIELSRKELADQGSEQLFVNTKTQRVDSLLEFYLGNFIIPDRVEGKYLFVCQFYDSVEMTFKGLDSQVSGNIGSMVFRAPCLMEEKEDEDKKKKKFIGPFYFPLEDVLKQSELGSKFDFSGENGTTTFAEKSVVKMEFALKEKDTLVRFYKMAPSMNDNWLLTVIRFFNSSEEGDGFFVTFTPGEESPYFELQFRESN